LFTTALIEIPQIDVHFKPEVWCPFTLNLVGREIQTKVKNSSLREAYINEKLNILSEVSTEDQTLEK
jgi:hypothetical protein